MCRYCENMKKRNLRSGCNTHHKMKATTMRALSMVTTGLSFILKGPQSHLNHTLLSLILAPCQVGRGGGLISGIG